MPISWISSETISVPTTAAALLRVTVEKQQADAGDREDRHQVDEQAGADEHERAAGRDRRAGQRRERVEARTRSEPATIATVPVSTIAAIA